MRGDGASLLKVPVSVSPFAWSLESGGPSSDPRNHPALGFSGLTSPSPCCLGEAWPLTAPWLPPTPSWPQAARDFSVPHL